MNIMLDFYVYILQCNDGSFYVGHTDNISERFDQHNMCSFGSYVSKRLPVKLVYCEPVGARDAAKDFEKRIKGWSRKKKEALIKGGFAFVQDFILKYKIDHYYCPVDPSTSSGRTGMDHVCGE